MIIVGICGGSGKSTFAERIRDGLSCSCEIMRLDCYYFDQGGKPFEERTKVNYDSPEIFDFDEMLEDIRLLLDGKPVTRRLQLCRTQTGRQRRADVSAGGADNRGNPCFL